MADPFTTMFGLSLGFQIFGAFMGGMGRSQQLRHQRREAQLRALYEPGLILNQARYQAQILRRQAELARMNAEFTKKRKDILYGLSIGQIGRIKRSADRQIERRNAIAADRIKRNNRITEERRDVLLRRLGYKAQDVGEAAGTAMAERDVRRSASGFSLSSISYERRRLASRNQLRDRLARLNEEFHSEDELLVLQNYNQNLTILEQAYLQNEGAREQVFLRASDIRDQAVVRNVEMSEAVLRSQFSRVVNLERAEHELEHGTRRAEYSQRAADLQVGSYASALGLSWLSTAFDVGSILAPTALTPSAFAPASGNDFHLGP